MSIVLFISETKLKESSAINGNVDDVLIRPIILECQRLYIEPIVGTGVYNQLITQVADSSLSALNTTLLNEYIVPCLIAYVKYECPVELNYKFTNKNVSKKNSENSTPNDLEETRFLMDRLKNKAQYYAERVTKYLCENSEDYPLYLNQTIGIDTVTPSVSNYNTGMVLDDYDCKGCGHGSESCRCWNKIHLG